MIKRFFLLSMVSALTAPGFLLASVPSHVENPVFDAKKAPIIDETKPSDTHSKAEWGKNLPLKLPACGKNPVWSVQDAGLIEATAIKEKNVPVRGKFTRFAFYATEIDRQIQGKGVLDLSSWDSGLPPRDFRVMKYVFGVEERGQSTVPFHFTADTRKGTLDPSAKAFEAPLVLDLKFRGQAARLIFQTQFQKTGGTLKIKTKEADHFSFLTAARMGAFAKLMSLCNHHFLGSSADVSVDVTLEAACPIP